MLQRLEELCNLSGVSGDEGRVRAYIKEAVKTYASDIHTDAMGNLYVHKRGKGRRVMACAHMDEVGMMVRGIRDDGLLAYAQTGLDARVVVSKRVLIGEDAVPGIIGAKAIHLQTREEFKAALKHKDLYIDIGAKDKADAEKYIKLGDYVSFPSNFSLFGDGLIRSKALDDRCGCAILIELLKNDYDCDFTAVFTVQEEVGVRGAQTAAYNAKPELALILEGTTANDMPKTEGHEYVTMVGMGPAISVMDGGTMVLPRMFNALRATAKKEGIPFQLRKGTRGGTDAGAIHKSLSGVVCGGISVACRYIHSPASVASVNDFENAYKLAHSFLKNRTFEEVLKNV
jgi:endoglucanase